MKIKDYAQQRATFYLNEIMDLDNVMHNTDYRHFMNVLKARFWTFVFCVF